MASFIFHKPDPLSDHLFYSTMRDEVTLMVKEFEAVFMYYKGSFVFNIDRNNLNTKYDRAQNEFPDSLLLETHLLFLDKKLLQIAQKIKL